jgi:tetratricopeptide (TPR) repeat protein
MAQDRKKWNRQRTANPTGRTQRWRTPGIGLALAAITFAVFGQTLRHEFFNFDDGDYVYDNPVVAPGLTLHGLAWACTQSHFGNWHPLTWLSHELDCQIYGLRPWGHHLTNVLLHTATVILLFLVLRRMTGAVWRSAFVAAVFAIHPLRVESVAWVAERKDVLSGLFFMLSIGAYVRYAENLKFQIFNFKFFYVLALVFFALALMAKPMVVTLPLLLLLLDYWPLKRVESARRLVLEKLPFLALTTADSVVTMLAQNPAMQSIGSIPLLARFDNALVSCMVYLGQTVWPAGLAVLYPLSRSGPPTGQAAVAALLLAGLFAAAWRERQQRPWILMGWLWYLVMLAPVIGIIQVGEQAHADRYTYLPQIGIYVAATWLAAQWQPRRVVLGILMPSVIAALMVCACNQTAYWKDSESVWRRCLACTTRNASAHYNLGNALLQKGQVDEAILHYQEALDIRPTYQSAHYNLGNALLQKGQVDDAIVHYLDALEIRPDDVEARINLGTALLQKGAVDDALVDYQKAVETRPDFGQAHAALGNALMAKGQVDEAITQLQMALRINPGYAEGHFNLGNALLQKGKVDEALDQFQKSPQNKRNDPKTHNYLGLALFQQGRMDDAITHFQIAVQFKPDEREYHKNLGAALLQKGREEEAITQFREALQLGPDDPEALNNLAWLLAASPQAALRDGPKAVQLAQRANDLAGGKNAIFLHTLAAALAEAGRFSEAVEMARQASRLTEAQSETGLTRVLQSEIRLYQAGIPYHIPAQTH